MLHLTIAIAVALTLAFMLVPARHTGPPHQHPQGFDVGDCWLEEDESLPGIHVGVCRRSDPLRLAMVWADEGGAAAYRAIGKVDDYLIRCGSGNKFTPKGFSGFAETLPANTTWFRLPDPEVDTANQVSEYNLRLEAVDSEGRVLKHGGHDTIIEPPACPGEGF